MQVKVHFLNLSCTHREVKLVVLIWNSKTGKAGKKVKAGKKTRWSLS